MTHLREAVVAITQPLNHRPRPPQTQATELLGNLSGTPSEAEPPPPSLLEELRRRLLDLYVKSSRAEVERRDLREAPWLLWNGTPVSRQFRASSMPFTFRLPDTKELSAI